MGYGGVVHERASAHAHVQHFHEVHAGLVHDHVHLHSLLHQQQPALRAALLKTSDGTGIAQ